MVFFKKRITVWADASSLCKTFFRTYYFYVSYVKLFKNHSQFELKFPLFAKLAVLALHRPALTKIRGVSLSFDNSNMYCLYPVLFKFFLITLSCSQPSCDFKNIHNFLTDWQLGGPPLEWSKARRPTSPSNSNASFWHLELFVNQAYQWKHHIIPFPGSQSTRDTKSYSLEGNKKIACSSNPELWVANFPILILVHCDDHLLNILTK